MSRFITECHPVTEGWGLLGSILFGPIGTAAYVALQWSNINKIMSNSKVQKYITKECDKLYVKSKKSNKNLKAECPTGFVALFKKNPAVLSNTRIMERLKNPGGGTYRVGKYTVVPFGDTDHVELIVVVFYDPTTDLYTGHRIPAPTNDDLKSLGLRKEE